jgi:hypothetical protein
VEILVLIQTFEDLDLFIQAAGGVEGLHSILELVKRQVSVLSSVHAVNIELNEGLDEVLVLD